MRPFFGGTSASGLRLYIIARSSASLDPASSVSIRTFVPVKQVNLLTFTFTGTFVPVKQVNLLRFTWTPRLPSPCSGPPLDTYIVVE
jgi:hypothetical protein